VQWFISIIAGIAVGIAWLAIWALSLRPFGIAVFSRRPEDRIRRRERIKQMGKLWYILIFGVAGSGLAVGLAIAAADFLGHISHGWVTEIGKLVFLSLIVGWLQGARTWGEAFRDPAPFPPN
jgi:uncharacterized membrane protein YccF (DUF307 family)